MAFRELMPWKKKELGERRGTESPLDSLHREMDRVLERFSHGFGLEAFIGPEESWGGFLPAVDISETDDEIHVTAEIPGLEADDLDVSLSGRNLILRGEKKSESVDKREHYTRKESTYGAFHRTIPLPTEVSENRIEATYRKGVLKVRLPKTPEARKERKKITVH